MQSCKSICIAANGKSLMPYAVENCAPIHSHLNSSLVYHSHITITQNNTSVGITSPARLADRQHSHTPTSTPSIPTTEHVHPRPSLPAPHPDITFAPLLVTVNPHPACSADYLLESYQSSKMEVSTVHISCKPLFIPIGDGTSHRGHPRSYHPRPRSCTYL